MKKKTNKKEKNPNLDNPGKQYKTGFRTGVHVNKRDKRKADKEKKELEGGY